MAAMGVLQMVTRMAPRFPARVLLLSLLPHRLGYGRAFAEVRFRYQNVFGNTSFLSALVSAGIASFADWQALSAGFVGFAWCRYQCQLAQVHDVVADSGVFAQPHFLQALSFSQEGH